MQIIKFLVFLCYFNLLASIFSPLWKLSFLNVLLPKLLWLWALCFLLRVRIHSPGTKLPMTPLTWWINLCNIARTALLLDAEYDRQTDGWQMTDNFQSVLMDGSNGSLRSGLLKKIVVCTLSEKRGSTLVLWLSVTYADQYAFFTHTHRPWKESYVCFCRKRKSA